MRRVATITAPQTGPAKLPALMLDRLKSFSDNLSLRQKVAAVVAIPLALLLFSVALFWQYEKESRLASDIISHTLQVQSELHEFLMLVSDSQSAVRGYRLIGDKALLDLH